MKQSSFNKNETKETRTRLKTPSPKFRLRTPLCAITGFTLLVIATSSLAQGTNSSGPGSFQFNAANAYPYQYPVRPLQVNPNFPKVLSAPSLPKGAVHLMVHSGGDAQRIFTYFPSPPWVTARPRAVGLYRLEVNSQGTVAAVTILKSMGSELDVTVMKTLVNWRAKPGPLRIVDISWLYF